MVTHKDPLVEGTKEDLEKELQRSYEYLDSILLNIPTGVAILEGPEFRFFRINKVLADINGLSIEDHLGKTVAEILPNAAEHIIPNLRKIRESGKATLNRRIDIRLPKNLQQVRHILDSHFPIKINGNVVAVGAVVRDITETKNKEQELKLFRDVINESSDGIFVVEPQSGRFLDVNHRACDMLGYEREELLSLCVSDVQVVLSTPQAWQKFREKLEKEKHFMLQGSHKRRDSTTFPVEVTIRYVEREGKNYLVAISRDVTERKKAEEEKRRLQEQLKAYSKLLERKVKKLETDKVTLNRNEQVFLTSLALNPLLTDQEISNRTNIKRSTITAIRNRLLRNNYFHPVSVPNFRFLGCTMFTLLFGAYPLPEEKPIQVVFELTNGKRFIRCYLFRNYEEYIRTIRSQKNVHHKEFTQSLRATSWSESSQIGRFLGRLFGIADTPAPKSRSTQKRPLSKNEINVLLSLTRHPRSTNQRLANLIGLSKLTIAKKKKKLIAQSIIRPTIVFDVQILNLKLITLSTTPRGVALPGPLCYVMGDRTINLNAHRDLVDYAHRYPQAEEIFRFSIDEETKVELSFAPLTESLLMNAEEQLSKR